ATVGRAAVMAADGVEGEARFRPRSAAISPSMYSNRLTGRVGTAVRRMASSVPGVTATLDPEEPLELTSKVTRMASMKAALSPPALSRPGKGMVWARAVPVRVVDGRE